jgi:restriction system protein
MAIPDYETMMLPVLRAFAAGAKNVAEIVPLVQKEFAISNEEAALLIPSGSISILASRVHWARTYLGKAGLLTSPKRNLHVITPAGEALLAQSPAKIDNALLSQFAAFTDWKGAGQDAAPGQVAAVVPLPPATETPDELIHRVHAEIEQALEADLLERMQVMDPVRFERLILDLLRAMGYGAGSLAQHMMTKASGDGGIDGIIYEDALGLDAVYVQAKRYADKTVGRPALQAFVGALSGEGATKGVFVTTSDFSKEARDYLTKVQQQHRVVLISGADLARRMVRHGVGVRDRATYVIRSVDGAYFDGEDG